MFWRVKNFGKRYVFIFIILISVTLQDEESDIQKFLENIKRSIQNVISRTQRRKKIRNAKSIRHKKKIRKGLIQKLSNPFLLFRKPEHYIINVKSQNSRGRSGQWPGGKIGKENLRLISKVLRENPLLSFKVPNFEKFLKKTPSQNSSSPRRKENSNLEPSTQIEYQTYFESIVGWMEEYARTPYHFWLTVQYVLFDNEKGRMYFSNYVCKNLTLYNNAQPFFWSPYGVKYYGDKKDALAPLVTDISGPYKIVYKVSGTDIHYHKKIAKEKINARSDLCNDFVVLNSQGLLIKELFTSLNRCVNLFKSNISYFLSDIECKELSIINGIVN